ncbi:MAG: hypothetical protein QM757_30770 [Paludibaculum sp.]
MSEDVLQRLERLEAQSKQAAALATACFRIDLTEHEGRLAFYSSTTKPLDSCPEMLARILR